jgi:tetratricopeptide (TPR) repeat protein
VHASLLSGLLPFDHGVRDNAGFVLKDSVRTLAELLRNRGFNTGAAVSSFLLRQQSGIAQGFSFFDGELPDIAADDALVGRDGLATWDAAERWVRTQTGQRFFLFVQAEQAAAEPIVARLVAWLRQARLYEPATIILIGDPAGESNTELTELALRVPLIVKQPDSTGSGRRVTAVAQQVDVVPTVLDLVRGPIPSGLRGRSLRPVLDSENGVIPDQPIYAESLEAHYELGGAPVFAITIGQHQYIRGRDETFTELRTADGSHSMDPSAPETARLRNALDRLIANQTIDPSKKVAQADEERYAALGYLPWMRLGTPQSAPDANDPALFFAHRAIARLVAHKKFSAAIDGLRALARKHPTLAIAEYQLGALLARTGRLDEAITAFRSAAALNPDSPDIPLAIADALVRLRRYDDAMDQTDLALALAELSDASARSAAHEAVARIALARNDADAATLHAAEAQKADPTLPLTPFVRGRLLYNSGRYDEALTAFQESEGVLLKKDSVALPELHYYLGDTLAQLDRYDDAEMEFREEVRLFPRNIRPYSSLAMLYRASNRHREVEQVIRDLTEAVPTPEGYSMAARLWTILGERSRAEAVRLDARARFRGDPSLALFERWR